MSDHIQVMGFSFQFIIGSGENMSDFTFSENVAHAHICAAEALDSRVVSVAGKVCFLWNIVLGKELLDILIVNLSIHK